MRISSIRLLILLLASLNINFGATQASNGLKSVIVSIVLCSLKENCVDSDALVNFNDSSQNACTSQLAEQLEVIGELPTILATEGEIFKYEIPVDSIFYVPKQCNVSISTEGQFSLFDWVSFNKTNYLLQGIPPQKSDYHLKFIAQVMHKRVSTRRITIRVLGEKTISNSSVSDEGHHNIIIMEFFALSCRVILAFVATCLGGKKARCERKWGILTFPR